MKYRLLTLTILLLGFASCRKNSAVDPAATDLSGSWRMIIVTDKNTNAVVTKPGTIKGEVEITFTYSTANTGNITGNTPTNAVTGDYIVGANRLISIPVLIASQVVETSWGKEFLNNFGSSQDYFFFQRWQIERQYKK